VTQTTPEPATIRNAVMLACRAPSLHNSQPWRWVAARSTLHLFADPTRLLMTTDSTGREMILSCGAVLDHLRVAMAASGWDTTVERFPDVYNPHHLAVIHISAMDSVTEAHRRRADAILRRRTDRLPFSAPAKWSLLEPVLRSAVNPYNVMFAVIVDDARPRLAEASRLTEALRHVDPSYQSELRWWASPFELDDGVPQTALVSTSEARRVDVARAFPPAGGGDRRAELGDDRSKIVVLSTFHEDGRLEVLRCGEALSAVLLECTLAGMATCTLTHMTEVAPSRDIIRSLTGQAGQPQLLIRVGRVPAAVQHLPATPRRPLEQVLEFRPRSANPELERCKK
jgi:hypothetical protein